MVLTQKKQKYRSVVCITFSYMREMTFNDQDLGGTVHNTRLLFLRNSVLLLYYFCKHKYYNNFA
jgi:hypothetical protein